MYIGTTKVCIRPTKSVHPTYEKSISELQKVNIRPTKSVHPTYKNFTSDLQKEYIRPTKSVHPTYKKCTSDLQTVYIRPTNSTSNLQKVYRSDLQKEHIRPTNRYVHLTSLHAHDQNSIMPVGRIKKIKCVTDLQLSQVGYSNRSENQQVGSSVQRMLRIDDATLPKDDIGWFSIILFPRRHCD